jgi:citrate lyase beta subunit
MISYDYTSKNLTSKYTGIVVDSEDTLHLEAKTEKRENRIRAITLTPTTRQIIPPMRAPWQSPDHSNFSPSPRRVLRK